MLSPFADIAFAGAVDRKLPASPLTPRNQEAHGLQPVVPLKLVDDMGRPIRLARPAGRIVSLSPSITEMVFEAGAGAKLVGIARHSD
ncbi:MAG TPA: hypothetical protein VFI43_09330, partial [Nitrosospira sp.]|nr:hypothetical protein [Nitrosospira sp.]